MEVTQNARGGRRAGRGGAGCGRWKDMSEGKENQPRRRFGAPPQAFGIRRDGGKRKQGSSPGRAPLIDITYLFLQEVRAVEQW